MNIAKTLALTAAALACGTGSSFAQFFDFNSNSFANYRQSASGDVSFEGGSFGVTAQDGLLVFRGGCISDSFFVPSIIPFCPEGSTGFITQGDVDGDGIDDLGDYLSVLSINRAIILQPFDSAGARLVSAPPSQLPRPLAGFTDTSAVAFFNLFTTLIEQFNITLLSFSRTFDANERNRFDGEVVPGTYVFNFTQLVDDFATTQTLNNTPPVVIGLNLFTQIDGFRRVNNIRQGFRFTNVSFDDDGFFLLDPLALNFLTWEGNTISVIAPAADFLFLSIKPILDPADPNSAVIEFDGGDNFVENPAFQDDPSGFDPGPNTAFDDFGNPEFIPNPTLPIFPNFVGAGADRVTLSSPLLQQYIIPPGFLSPGQSGVLDLEFQLNRPTTSVISDSSTRSFRIPVRVISAFTTFITANLPQGASTAEQDEDYDFDGDGSSNFAEWAFGTDPASAASTPALSSIQTSTQETASEGFITEDEGDSVDSTALKYEINKLVHSKPALDYTAEFSTDMVTWITVTDDNPDFDVVETEDKITVTTVGAPEGGGFFRSKAVVR